MAGYVLEDMAGTEIEITGGYIHPSVDTDIFRFYVEDGWFDWFNVDVTLTDVPGTVDMTLALLWVEDSDGDSHGEVDSSDEGGLGGDEAVSFTEDMWLTNQTGWYEVVINSTHSSSCDNDYTLIVTANTR